MVRGEGTRGFFLFKSGSVFGLLRVDSTLGLRLGLVGRGLDCWTNKLEVKGISNSPGLKGLLISLGG